MAKKLTKEETEKLFQTLRQTRYFPIFSEIFKLINQKLNRRAK